MRHRQVSFGRAAPAEDALRTGDLRRFLTTFAGGLVFFSVLLF